MPLDTHDKDVLVKLHDEMLDWFFAGEIVQRRWFVVVAQVRGYGVEIAAMLVGIGIGGPVSSYVKGDASAVQDAIGQLFRDPFAFPANLAVVAAATWGLLGVVAVRNDVMARATFARDFARTMRQQWRDLEIALRQPDPMADVLKIQQIIDRKVREATDKEILDWSRLPPNSDAERELAKQRLTDYLRQQCQARWTGRQSEELKKDE